MLRLRKPLLPPWRWWPLCSLAALVLVAVIGLSLSRHPQKPQDHTTANNKKYYRAVDNDPAASFTIGTWASDNHDAIEALAAIVSAFFAIVLTGSTIGLWIVTRTAANAAQKSANALPAIERAYVFVVPTIISSKTMPKMKGVSYHFVNHGKTPAIINGIERHFAPLTGPPDNTRFLANIPDHNGVVIAAGDRYLPEQNGIYEPIQVTNMKDAIAGEIPEIEFSWFYGTIAYRDVFENQRYTRFRWCYNRVTKEFGPCSGPPHNERT
jgi:hypothetical protein